MTPTRTETAHRVTSPDGTQIAYWTSGEGPPLLLVHGTTADHSRWRPLLPLLEPTVAVHAMDRRGRGASGDGPDYALEREYEDVAAVVDAIAADTGAAVDVLGHSFGGFCAFGAARLTSNIGRLVLYEGWPAAQPTGMVAVRATLERMDELLVQGEPEAALEVFMREVVEMPEEDLAVYRELPAWQARIAAVHTIAREERVTPRLDPRDAAAITAPVLLIVGGASPDKLKNDFETVAAALPDATVVVIEGQQHIAIDLVPETFARHVLDFLHSER